MRIKTWVLFVPLGMIVLSGYGCSPAPRFRVGGETTLQTGIASYYGSKYHGRKTANGETFDMYALTAAHNELPFGTKIKVTNLNNHKGVVVRINDRGPFVKGRILDLSYGAAQKLEMIGTGTAPVKIEVLEFGEGR